MNKQDDFRLRFETRDGIILKNRVADRSFYFTSWGWDKGKPDKGFIEATLKTEAREKGVRIISWTIDQTCLKAIVEWL